MSKEHKGKAPSQKADDKDIHSEQTLEDIRDTPTSINHPPGSVSYEPPEEDELERTYEPGGERVKVKLPMSADEQIEEEKRTAEQDHKLATQKPEEVWEEERKRDEKRGSKKPEKEKEHEPKKHK